LTSPRNALLSGLLGEPCQHDDITVRSNLLDLSCELRGNVALGNEENLAGSYEVEPADRCARLAEPHLVTDEDALGDGSEAHGGPLVGEDRIIVACAFVPGLVGGDLQESGLQLAALYSLSGCPRVRVCEGFPLQCVSAHLFLSLLER